MADKVAGLLFRIAADTKALQAGFRQAQAATGKVQKSVQMLGGALLATFGARTVLRGIGQMVTIIKGFEQSMADVQSIVQGSAVDIKRLSELAKELGGSTKFTASEVAQLEKEYAKLGFTVSQIEKMAEATLNLAAATGTELARAAEVAGGVVRSFGLDAEKTTHVTNVMAKSFSMSALDMEKFAEAMKYVGPVAASANITLEESTAMLAILANNMIDGSMAGTSLKMIINKLSKDGGPLRDRLTELAEAGLNLADAEKEVGMRAQTSLLILAKYLDLLPEVQRELEEVGDVSKKMAEIQLDTLEGQLTILKSAWQGLVIEMGTSTDGMDKAKKGTGFLSDALVALTDNLDKVAKAYDVWFQYLMPVYGVLKLIANDPAIKKLFGGPAGGGGSWGPAQTAPTTLGTGGLSKVYPTTPISSGHILSKVGKEGAAGTTSGQGAGISPSYGTQPGLVDFPDMLRTIKELPGAIAPAQQAIIDFSMVLQQTFMDAVGIFGQGIQNLFAGTASLEGGFSKVLGTMGKFMVQMGSLFIAWAIAQEAFAASLKAMFTGVGAPAVFAAGVALVAIGSAISGLAARRSSGGGGGGGSLIAGGGVGAYANPVPQRIHGDIVVQGSDLHIALSNYSRRQGRM
jgi:uncharacterized protein YukE